MKKFLIATLATAFLLAAQSFAFAKTALVVTGIGGTVVAPMTQIEKGLKAKGYKVIRATYLYLPNVKVDVAIGHSAGADAVLRTGAKKILTIDPTWLNGGCPRGSKCVNWYAPADAFPFIICCGGYRVSGARNTVVPAGHVTMPARIATTVVAEAIRP